LLQVSPLESQKTEHARELAGVEAVAALAIGKLENQLQEQTQRGKEVLGKLEGKIEG